MFSTHMHLRFTHLLSLCYKRIGSCLVCVDGVMDARGKFGEHEDLDHERNSNILSALKNFVSASIT